MEKLYEKNPLVFLLIGVPIACLICGLFGYAFARLMAAAL